MLGMIETRKKRKEREREKKAINCYKIEINILLRVQNALFHLCQIGYSEGEKDIVPLTKKKLASLVLEQLSKFV